MRRTHHSFLKQKQAGKEIMIPAILKFMREHKTVIEINRTTRYINIFEKSVFNFD